MSSKKRIDLLLVDRGLAESRSTAQKLIMAGLVRVEGQLIHKASQKAEPGMLIEVASGPRFVSRGGEKLQAALEMFTVALEDRLCADVGASTGGFTDCLLQHGAARVYTIDVASTGGFTDCLLQHGAARVYTIDVGKGLLHWKLRNDARVVVIEKTNARYLESLPERVHLVTMDVSFISLRKLLPVIIGWLEPGGDVIATSGAHLFPFAGPEGEYRVLSLAAQRRTSTKHRRFAGGRIPILNSILPENQYEKVVLLSSRRGG
jgi:23S rRNA (cytidine1920-2'-O)/16S rRNA (cytidine1409-2'-O)-methyltransferase